MGSINSASADRYKFWHVYQDLFYLLRLRDQTFLKSALSSFALSFHPLESLLNRYTSTHALKFTVKMPFGILEDKELEQVPGTCEWQNVK
jgi:hypothetical protein